MMTLREMEEEHDRQQALLRELSDWREIDTRLRRAQHRVVRDDFELLEDGANERAVAHRLAVYLEHEFPGLHVDCEFNRQGNKGEGARDRKQVAPRPPLLPLPKRRPNSSGLINVEPDIIVHRRRRSDWNILVVEVKPSGHADIPKDREKLKAYLSTRDLLYKFAALVVYHIGDGATFEEPERVTIAT